MNIYVSAIISLFILLLVMILVLSYTIHKANEKIENMERHVKELKSLKKLYFLLDSQMTPLERRTFLLTSHYQALGKKFKTDLDEK